ncbi:hypothetical protein J7E71_16700 [Mesobacillus foraminis]|uniref:hypothetical protein n=1 Tax=Mesobacillus foraminis TaxID=279826 RepID=UPI001BED07F3|nr:hypothetical protein [Mesobacillus foraminis]MBT2757533.1 hypothetical protein [Mesobacillus foraminis]
MFKKSQWLILLLLVLMLILISACNKVGVRTELYEGKALTIGVVGKPPKVNETDIKFNRIQLTDILKEDFHKSYDGIFIMKDSFIEASEPKYATVYQNSSIPFFFIETEKSYLPFVDKELSYKDAITIKTKSYATGYLKKKEQITYWEYGLYNDEVNGNNIRDAYSRIFKTISENRYK